MNVLFVLGLAFLILGDCSATAWSQPQFPDTCPDQERWNQS